MQNRIIITITVNYYLQQLHCCSPSLFQCFSLQHEFEQKQNVYVLSGKLLLAYPVITELTCTWGVMPRGWSSQSHKRRDK